MTEPIAVFKIKVWPDVVDTDGDPIYEVLVKKSFGFATYYKRVSYALNLEQVGLAIQNYKKLEKMTSYKMDRLGE